MEKYATYEVFKDAETGEISRVPYSGKLEKKASVNPNLKKLEEDPEDK